jgi:hypothetical protein
MYYLHDQQKKTSHSGSLCYFFNMEMKIVQTFY